MAEDKCSECGTEYGLDQCAVAGCGDLLCEDCACVLGVEYDTLGDDMATICRACRDASR